MERRKYVIIPKGDDAELFQWGLDVKHNQVLRQLSCPSTEQLYTWDDLSKRNVPYDAGDVFIFSSCGAAPCEQLCIDKLASLLPKEAGTLRFFIHFGDLNISKDLPDELAIMKQFKNRLPTADEAQCDCFPFTGEANDQYFWNTQLWNLQRRLFAREAFVDDELLTELDKVWDLAISYFRVERPISAVLSALFPLFLTLSGKESDVDRDFALKSAQCIVNDTSFSLARSGVLAYAKRRDTQLSLKYDFSSPELKSDGFVEWYRSLSKAYTVLTRTEENIRDHGAGRTEGRSK